MTILVPISDARERAFFGGKAAHLAFMTGMGLRVPPGAVVVPGNLPSADGKIQIDLQIMRLHFLLRLFPG